MGNIIMLLVAIFVLGIVYLASTHSFLEILSLLWRKIFNSQRDFSIYFYHYISILSSPIKNMDNRTF